MARVNITPLKLERLGIVKGGKVLRIEAQSKEMGPIMIHFPTTLLEAALPILMQATKQARAADPKQPLAIGTATGVEVLWKNEKDAEVTLFLEGPTEIRFVLTRHQASDFQVALEPHPGNTARPKPH